MKPHLRLIAALSWLVPRHRRAEWRREWEAEFRSREEQPELALVRRSTSAFWDAWWLQRTSLEGGMLHDLRYAIRMLVRQPGFTLVIVTTLALGIGANTAIFSLLDKLVIRTLPAEQPDRLATFVTGPDGGRLIVSYPAYTALRERVPLIPAIAAHAPRPFSLADGAAADRVAGAVVSGNYFSLLGVHPAAGRFFAEDEDRTPGTHAVAVIGHGLWRRRFASDPGVIGRRVTLNAQAFTVIGVTPPEFTGTTAGTVTDVYVPMMMAPSTVPGAARILENPNWGWLRLIGRLAPGATHPQAQAALAPIVTELNIGGKPAAKKDPANLAGSPPPVLVLDGRRGYQELVVDLARPLALLMGAVGFVLVIACANVASLLLARALRRRHEIAVRLATGASRSRIVRLLLTEGLLLSALGGAAGMFVAARLTAFLVGFQQQMSYTPRALDGSLDGRALAFALGVCVLTGLVFGLMPARQALARDVVRGLQGKTAGDGQAGWSLRSLLIVGQVALSVVVLVGAGLFAKSLLALQAIDTGLEPSRVVTASFDLGMNRYDEARGRSFADELVQRVSAIPGVESAGLGNVVAFSDRFWISGATIEGYDQAPGERMAFDFNAVGPGYFRTIGVPLAAGREFTAADTAGAPPVVMVNEALARRYWPGQSAVGKRVNRGPLLEVVGVVRDSRVTKVSAEAKPTIYLPLLQNYSSDLTLHVRSTGDARTVLARVRQEIQAIDPAVAVYNLQTLEAQKNGSLYSERLSAMLLGLFGALALALVAIGLYGILSYSVAERTREIGIRLALGAQPRDLLSLVIRRGLLLTLAGSGIGVAAALATVRLVQRLLFGVSPTDPQVFAIVPIGLLAVALLACWIPARRATRLNPVRALRHEQ
jgi:predicted permease